MSYLLSTQFVLDILTNRSAAISWYSKTPARSVELSAVSIGQAEQQIEHYARPANRNGLLKALRRLEASLDLPGHKGVIPFEAEAARIWARLIDEPLHYTPKNGEARPLSQASKMVVATALATGATIVEAPHPYHNDVARLTVEHP